MNASELELAGGRRLSEGEIAELQRAFDLPPPLARALASWPLAGARVVLPWTGDESGEGVEMLWMTPAQMIEEARHGQSGSLAVRAGYIPIGICLEGSGDPYFYRSRDGAIVRVLWDAVHGTLLDEEEIDIVDESLEKFLALAGAEP